IDRLGARIFRALEHQMFEEMGEAGTARRVVLSADAIADVDGDGRDPMILNQQNAETVGERAIGEVDGRDRDPGARNSTGQDWPNALRRRCFPLSWAEGS